MNPEDLFSTAKVYVAASKVPKAGKGVFAAQKIAEGELIERCPLIICKKEDKQFLRQTDLLNYYYRWDVAADDHQAAIALGYGSLYNHSYTPNAIVKKNFDKEYIEIVALRDIAPGEEITHNYNGDPDDKKRLWIEKIPPFEHH